MKKIIVSTFLMMAVTAFAQNSNNNQQLPSGYVTPSTNIQLPPGVELPKGKFESVPGGNPFVFCHGPRPPKHSEWRAVYDRVCKDDQNGHMEASSNNTQTPSAPVGGVVSGGAVRTGNAAVLLK